MSRHLMTSVGWGSGAPFLWWCLRSQSTAEPGLAEVRGGVRVPALSRPSQWSAFLGSRLHSFRTSVLRPPAGISAGVPFGPVQVFESVPSPWTGEVPTAADVSPFRCQIFLVICPFPPGDSSFILAAEGPGFLRFYSA